MIPGRCSSAPTQICLLQIKQKPRRSWKAIDPCLGYYPEIVSPPRPAPAVVAETHTEPQESIPRNPPHTLLSRCSTPHEDPLQSDASVADANIQNPSSERSDQVTVDEFLRRTAERCDRHYGRRRRKRKQISDYSDTEAEGIPGSKQRTLRRRATALPSSSDHVETADSEHEVKQQNIRRSKRKKNAGSLGKRLLHAAMISNVDPNDALLDMRDDTHIAVGAPLRLVLLDDTSSRRVSDHKVKWKLVDPRKCAPFESMASGFRDDTGKDKTSLGKRCQSMKRRQSTCAAPYHAVEAAIKGRMKPRTSYTPAKRPVVTPLTFVPLEEHEALIEVIFPRSGTKDSTSRIRLAADTPEPLGFHYEPLIFDQSPTPIIARQRQDIHADDEISQTQEQVTSSSPIRSRGSTSPQSEQPALRAGPEANVLDQDGTLISTPVAPRLTMHFAADLAEDKSSSLSTDFVLVDADNLLQARVKLASPHLLANVVPTTSFDHARSPSRPCVSVSPDLDCSMLHADASTSATPPSAGTSAPLVQTNTVRFTSTQSKVLKPLGSYLGSFLETARKASQMQPSVGELSTPASQHSHIHKRINASSFQLSRLSSRIAGSLSHYSEAVSARDNRKVMIPSYFPTVRSTPHLQASSSRKDFSKPLNRGTL
ncbi:hypothetical protein OBBRIDRAFT_49883 [Obba rivulosa]|uniref:Uncharacterized protein n=1 Tax=Obba rivulosa TaxID=1052685 RepID=A0A8E2DSH3_9APHY|nr:hypothetical protein OBBRIDRAFT_49883 [Obba rivulosa]